MPVAWYEVGFSMWCGYAEDHGVRAEFDPYATLDVHCGNGFDARFEPYQSARLSRYNAGL